MSASNCVSLDQEHILASDIFADTIGNCSSDAIIEQLSTEFEEREKKAVVRPWEERLDGTFAASYLQRAKKIDTDRKKNPPDRLDFMCSSEVARAELARYARMPRRELLQVTRLTVVENGEEKIVERQLNVEKIHRFQKVLGITPTDFTKAAPKAESVDYDKKLESYLELPLTERRKFVEETADRVLLGYIQSGDPELELARRAQERLFGLAMPGV